MNTMITQMLLVAGYWVLVAGKDCIWYEFHLKSYRSQLAAHSSKPAACSL